MDPEKLQEKLTQAVDDVIQKRLGEAISPMVASEVKGIVEKMRVDRVLYGNDITGLSDDQKKEFVKTVKVAISGMRVKANEELIEEQDNRGGYLVSVEVASAIVRIAASVGIIMGQAQKWNLKTDELDIPAYTGSFLEGEYLGVNSPGSLTGITFDSARLIAKKWQLAFAVGNDLLADASANLADWLLALAGEALANRIDKEGFVGASAPFVGIQNNANVPVYTMPTGKSTFASLDIVEASDIIAQVEESMLEGAAFFMHRTVWAKLRAQKDTAGNYIFGYTNTDFASFVPKAGGTKPAGFILGYPVYTTRHLPANSATAVSTKFAVFGNLKALAYGDKGDLRVAQAQSGTFGGKEIALADQTGLVFKHRHALVTTLPAAFVNIKTAAS